MLLPISHLLSPIFSTLCLLAFTVSAHASPAVPGLIAHPELDPALAGNILLGELNCTACHKPERAHRVASKGAPILTDVAARLRPDFLKKWILDPQSAKFGTTMPDVLSELPADKAEEVATAISHYLISRSKAPAPPEAAEEGTLERGDKLFHEVGCAACHRPDLEVTDQYHRSGLTAFLENPLATRPGGRMPNLNLSHWEAIDIANHLLRNQKAEIPNPKPNLRLAREGAAFFQAFGCASCHEPDPDRATNASPLAEIDLKKPCLTTEYDLSKAQRKTLAAAEISPDPKHDIELTLTRLNCIACHSRDTFGGPSNERLAAFTTTNPNLGPQASIPPSLTGVGAKLTPAWLRKILVNGESFRPYMNTRMPKFGADNVVHLVDLFNKSDLLPAAEWTRVKDEKLARETGVQLVGDKGLGCIACHTFKGESASTLHGIDLTTMTDKLQEDWFHHYLRDPQKFHPQTIMPSYWPGGKAVRDEILDGDAGQQIDAIWQYLSRGREARTPSGIKREPLPLLAAGDEAVMLRRNYRGIGKRGIGVGYPSGINLSFDAGQMRLGSLWTGDFAETSGVWRSQGSGTVSEASRDVFRFPEGPAFAILDAPKAPWPAENEKKATGFQFKGYTLDKKQRPTFLYTFGDIEVTDRFEDVAEPLHFKRTLTFSKSPMGFHFRVAAHEKILPSADGSAYQIGDAITVKLPARTPAILRDAETGKDLILGLKDHPTLTLEYHPRRP